MREAELREKARRASASEPVFAGPLVLLDWVALESLVTTGTVTGLGRRSSAHNLGLGGGGGVTGSSGAASPTSLSGCRVTELWALSDGGGDTPEVPVAASSLVPVFCVEAAWVFGGIAALGVMGRAGRTGFVGVRMCADDVTGLEEDMGTAAGGGVVGMVESTSEGASEVAGVSKSERAATVDECESVCSSVISPLSTGCSGSPSPVICSCAACCCAGSCRAASEGPTDLGLRRRWRRRGGNGSSGTESHGSGGYQGTILVTGAGGAGIGARESPARGGVDALTDVVGVAGDS